MARGSEQVAGPWCVHYRVYTELGDSVYKDFICFFALGRMSCVLQNPPRSWSHLQPQQTFQVNCWVTCLVHCLVTVKSEIPGLGRDWWKLLLMQQRLCLNLWALCFRLRWTTAILLSVYIQIIQIHCTVICFCVMFTLIQSYLICVLHLILLWW